MSCNGIRVYPAKRLPSLGELKEPLSPMSLCKSEGRHYTVKFVQGRKCRGVECLLCGLIGDLEFVKSKPCTPSPASPTPTVRDEDVCHDISRDEDIARAHQLENDRRMAEELQELAATQAELERLTLLQQLDAEELLLEGLLNEERALNLQKIKAAQYNSRLSNPVNTIAETPSTEAPSPENPSRTETPSPENPSRTETPSPADPSPRILFPDNVSPPPILDKKSAMSKLAGGSSDSVVASKSFDVPFGTLGCRCSLRVGLYLPVCLSVCLT